ncbi:MAG: hypothetical protein ACYTG4_05225 [Planctomycetota bacterium]
MRAVAVALLALLSVAPPARADGVPPEVREQLEHSDPKVRSKGLKALRGKEDRESVAAAVAMLDDRDAYCRDYACWIILRNLKSDEAVKTLHDRAARLATPEGRLAYADVILAGGQAVPAKHMEVLLRDRDPVVRATTLEVLMERRSLDAGGLSERVAKLQRDSDPGVRLAAMCALVAGKGDAADKTRVIEAALKDKDDRVRSGATPNMPDELFDELAESLAKDDDWGVRFRVAGRAPWNKPRVELLASMLDDDRVRVADAAHDALRLISALDLPPVKEDWLEWWEKSKDAWKPPNKQLRDAERPSVATYHGLPFRSDAVLFVIDLSGSMRHPLKKGDDRPRLEVAREELATTLDKLHDGTLVDVMTFMLTPSRALGSLKPLNASLRKKLMKWFDRQEHGRRGDLHGALESALSDPVADTVLLLGDGATSSGEVLFRERIQRRVRQLLRLRPMALHTVAFGGRDVDRKFMKDLAGMSGGRSTAR